MANSNPSFSCLMWGIPNTVLGVFQGATLCAQWRLTTSREQTADEYGILIHNLFNLDKLPSSGISGIMIASVVPPLNFVLAEMARSISK